MSSTKNPIPPRLDELMVDAATQGLSPQDDAELQAAIAADDVVRNENDAYAMAATAIELSLSKHHVEDLPQALREKLIASANTVVATPPQLTLAGTQADKPTAQAPAGFSFTDGRMFGWYAAIAALLALAFVLAVEPTGNTNELSEPTLVEQYEALAEKATTVAANWGFAGGEASEQYANCTGEVIWNAGEQVGFMKLKGLPVNDPTKEQYQLWIVDASRNTDIENTNRVDGGVFDITATGEVIVPINAKLMARDATAFAITVETPGGVVESKGPLQVLAAVDKG